MFLYWGCSSCLVQGQIQRTLMLRVRKLGESPAPGGRKLPGPWPARGSVSTAGAPCVPPQPAASPPQTISELLSSSCPAPRHPLHIPDQLRGGGFLVCDHSESGSGLMAVWLISVLLCWQLPGPLHPLHGLGCWCTMQSAMPSQCLYRSTSASPWSTGYALTPVSSVLARLHWT